MTPQRGQIVRFEQPTLDRQFGIVTAAGLEWVLVTAFGVAGKLEFVVQNLFKALNVGVPGSSSLPPSPLAIEDIYLKSSRVCECGAKKCGSDIHSSWCPMA